MALAPFFSRDVWLIKMCSILGNRIAIWTWTNMKPNEWFFECGCFCWFTPISDVMTVRAAFQVVWDIKVRLCLHNLSLILSIRPMGRRDIDKSNLCFFFHSVILLLGFILLHFNWNPENNRKRQPQYGWRALIRATLHTGQSHKPNSEQNGYYFHNSEIFDSHYLKQRHNHIYYLQFFFCTVEQMNTAFPTTVSRFNFQRY